VSAAVFHTYQVAKVTTEIVAAKVHQPKEKQLEEKK